MKLPGTPAGWIEPFLKHEFEVAGCPVTVVCPRQALPSLPWAWKGEFLDAFPATEIALLRRGFHLVYLGFPNQFGSPRAVSKWNALYQRMTEDHGFDRRPALIGLSRGALYCYNWAAANPEKVACLYGDAPVCDLRSWPGGKGRGCGSPANWSRVMEAYGFSSEAEAMAWPGNPVDRLEPLAVQNVPILHVYGEEDDTVPWQENTGVLAERYRTLGGSILLIPKPGCGHHPHGLSDPAPVVDFIVTHAVPVSAPLDTSSPARPSARTGSRTAAT